MKNLINLYLNSEKKFDTAFDSISDSKTYKRKLKGYVCHCSYCGYHRNENYRGKHYTTLRSIEHLKFPNWKLVSKNEKQYVPNTIEVFEYVNNVRSYYKIEWKGSSYIQ